MIKKMLVLFVFFVGCPLCGMENNQDLNDFKKNIKKKIIESQKRAKQEKLNKKKLTKEEANHEELNQEKLKHEDFFLEQAIVNPEEDQNSTSDEECAYTPVKYNSGEKTRSSCYGGRTKNKKLLDNVGRAMTNGLDVGMMILNEIKPKSDKECKWCNDTYFQYVTKNYKCRLKLKQDSLFKQLKEKGDELFAKRKAKWVELSKLGTYKIKPGLCAYVEWKSMQETKQAYQQLKGTEKKTE